MAYVARQLAAQREAEAAQREAEAAQREAEAAQAAAEAAQRPIVEKNIQDFTKTVHDFFNKLDVLCRVNDNKLFLFRESEYDIVYKALLEMSHSLKYNESTVVTRICKAIIPYHPINSARSLISLAVAANARDGICFKKLKKDLIAECHQRAEAMRRDCGRYELLIKSEKYPDIYFHRGVWYKWPNVNLWPLTAVELAQKGLQQVGQ